MNILYMLFDVIVFSLYSRKQGHLPNMNGEGISRKFEEYRRFEIVISMNERSE